MTTLTVNIGNKKTEKVIKAVLDAFGLNYNIEQDAKSAQRPLNKAEQKIYNNLERSFKQIKLHQEGKIELQDARPMLLALEAELR